jgi:hypothetical protein
VYNLVPWRNLAFDSLDFPLVVSIQHDLSDLETRYSIVRLWKWRLLSSLR